MPLTHIVLVLHLMGFVSGQFQVFRFPFSLVQKSPFNMTPTAFDDQYDGCVDIMEDKVGQLQNDEFAHTEYREVWKLAADKWDSYRPNGLKQDYAIAVLAYTQSTRSLYKQLNQAVRVAGKSEEYYLKNFHFKSLHFLLTRALQILRGKSQAKCYNTYRGVKGTRFVVHPSEKVRFGFFASSSLKESEAKRFGDDTFFTITTCHGAYIKDYSFFPGEEEVLIPPYEMFKFVESTETSTGKIHIHLTSAGTFSKYNCAYIKGAGVSHLHVNVQMPFLMWGFLLVVGTLGGPSFL